MNFIKCKEKGRKTMPNIKKLSAIFMSIVLLFSFLFNGVVVVSANYTIADCFTYEYNVDTQVYDASFNTSGYKDVLNELDRTEIIMPETYDDGSNGSHNVALKTGFSISGITDNLVTKIEFNSHVSSLTNIGAFKGFSMLNSVVFKCNGNDFKLGSNVFQNCQTALKRVDIYALGLSSSFNKLAFPTFVDHPDSKIHVVKGSSVKQQIIDVTKSGRYPVSEDKIIDDLTDSREASSIEINCDNINYGTKSGFKPTFKVKVGEAERADLASKVTYGLYASETGGSDLLPGKEDFSTLAVGHYWIRATLEGTDEYKGATAVKEVQVVDPNAAFKEGLKTLIDQGNATVAKHQETEGGLYYSVKDLQTALEKANTVYNNPAATVKDITDAISDLDTAINALVLKADLASEKERSSFILDVRNKYISEKETDYTAESWKESGFGDLLNELNTKYTSDYVMSGAVKSVELQELKSQLEEAFGKLVKRTDFETEYAALEEAMANAKAILDDNPAYKYADSQIETLQAAYDAADKILEDKESVTNRAVIINATADVNNAINSLVEVDKTELLSKLQSVIEEAEAMDSEKENYTAESYKVLTDAIEAAKGITENSTVTEIQTATENIRSAISGLEKDLDAIQAAKDELSKAVEEAEAIDSSKYTEESYAKVADAINEAKRLIARQNVNLTVSGLKAAQAALEEAIKGLKEKSVSPSDPKPSNNNNGSNNIKKPPVNNKVVVKTTSREDAVKAAKAKAKSQMKQAKIKKLKVKSKAKKTIKVTWKKVKKAKGYRVQVSTNRKFKKSKIIFEKHTKKKTLKITKKIKSGKTYYVRVSAYTTYKDINGKTQKVYSKNKPFKKVKVK